MEQLRLGRLERVVLREVWGGETRDFVNWLKEDHNIDFLSTALGRDLVLSENRQFDECKADICCEDAESGATVLVKVQFDETSDRELGQLLTLASGSDKVTLVWIADNISEHHCSAIRWLNDITNDNINVFGLEIDFWKIGDSPLAPTVNVVCTPANWRPGRKAPSFIETTPAAETMRPREPVAPAEARPQKATAAAEAKEGVALASNVAGTPAKKVNVTSAGITSVSVAAESTGKQMPNLVEYWTEFNRVLARTGSPLTPQKPMTQHWMHFPLGSPHFHLVITVSARDYLIAVGLILSGPDAKTHFHLLQHSKVAIENEIGAVLEWQELIDKTESHIFLRRYGVDPNNRDQWPEQHEWLCDKLERFRRAFATRVEALITDDDLENQLLDEPSAPDNITRLQ